MKNKKVVPVQIPEVVTAPVVQPTAQVPVNPNPTPSKERISDLIS